ncbi:hypothetical protein CBL_00269 [Carabus blaptoides fortunei]
MKCVSVNTAFKGWESATRAVAMRGMQAHGRWSVGDVKRENGGVQCWLSRFERKEEDTHTHVRVSDGGWKEVIQLVKEPSLVVSLITQLTRAGGGCFQQAADS